MGSTPMEPTPQHDDTMHAEPARLTAVQSRCPVTIAPVAGKGGEEEEEEERAMKVELYKWYTQSEEEHLAQIVAIQPRYSELRERLLTHGGSRVLTPEYQPMLDELLARGKVRSGLKARRIAGEPISCHQNALMYVFAHPDTAEVATGFALSSEGLWRQHSWVIEDNRILETTARRTRYFGIVLTRPEVGDFVRYVAPPAPRKKRGKKPA